MKIDLPCAIVRDLLPSYVEGLTEEETTTAVKDHLETCESCRSRYEAMKEPEPHRDTEKEVDFLKTIRKRNGKRIVISVILAVVLVLSVVFAKLFWIGSPCDGSSVAVSTWISEDGTRLTLELSEMNSGSVIRGVHMNNESGVVSVSAREVLVSPLYSDSITSTSFELRNIHQVDVFGRTVWQDGMLIDYHTNRMLGYRTPYVGNAPAVDRLISNMDLDAGHTLELQTAQEPYGMTIHFDQPIAENRRFMVEGNAYILLALVDNLGEVHWDDPNGYTDTLTLEKADAELPKLIEAYNSSNGTDYPILDSVKKYGTDSYHLQILRNVLGI